jgi:hypothetical protein
MGSRACDWQKRNYSRIYRQRMRWRLVRPTHFRFPATTEQSDDFCAHATEPKFLLFDEVVAGRVTANWPADRSSL